RVDRFDALLELARKVFVYIEEHVLYIEHWMWATFWSKSRELAAALVAMGALDDEDDVFYLRRTEVAETIYDVVAAWSVGRGRGRSAAHWRPVVGERRAIVEALRTRPAPAALGTPPATVNEPLTKMLWGISSETIERWRHGRDDDQVITGRAGSPGVAEGTARVVTETAGLSEIREGEILVCPATSPSWSPVFARIAATVSDIGGIMSHTAIVCREYGLPAVVGTGDACSSITTGQRIRVDGSLGTVTVLSGAGE
ncbi:MAG: PEP-utilizing protein mobile subunit, partial [Actinomycetia bacterium]|nr:PEP-utilizing protein mobile subunit [Actinomycetes bacterium]